MKISLNYIKHYLDFDLPPVDELTDVIGRRLGALEEQPINLGDVYKDVVIVRVVECNPIEGSDHLSLCLIDDGQKTKDVQRVSNGLIQVVCGAPNVKADINAVWLPPGAIVPSTYFKEPFKLEARTIQGQVSNGMLSSSSELAISDDHSGILIIESEIEPGSSFSSVYELDDSVIDIENKMFTHRPDCFGILGVAREISGILNHPFKSPDWYLRPDNLSGGDLSIKIQNEVPSLVPRFSLLAISNVEVKPSPLSIQSYLFRMGVRPVNNIVDLTNLVMLETGQPLHAYDLNKLKNLSGEELELSVRLPRPDESLKLLNGKEVKPSATSLCIAVKDQLVGLGGVMGGESTEVDDSTTAIILEAASFDMYAIRRTSMELGLFSEAVTRFTKGQSPLQTVRVLSYAFTKLKELLPEVSLSSGIVDDNHLPEETLKRDSLHPAITISADFINNRLGTELKLEQIAELLKNVECQVEVSGNNLTLTAPFWRTDLEIREDIVEEVGRLYGYENIKPKDLMRPVLASDKNKSLELKAELRQILSSAGANELLTYSFVSKKLIENASQSLDKTFELANSISPELQHYRLSLTPSLLTKVNMNIKAGFEAFALFEIGSYHLRDQFSESEPEIPAEYPSLALIYASKTPAAQAAYFKAKQFLSFLLEELNINGISFEPLSKVDKLEERFIELAKPFDPSRSALVKIGDKQLGVVGEFKPSTTKSLKLPKYSAGFEVDSSLLMDTDKISPYRALSKYPPVKQDVTLSVPDNISYGELNNYLTSELSKQTPKDTSYSFEPISLFKPKDSESVINYTFHLLISSEDRTLKDEEINNLLDQLASLAHDKFGASRV